MANLSFTTTSWGATTTTPNVSVLSATLHEVPGGVW